MDEHHRNRGNPADEGDACKQTQARGFSIDRLAAQLQAHSLLRAAPLLLYLRALQFEARVVAIERLLQRRNDNVGEAGFYLAGETLRRSGLRDRCVRWRRR